MRRYVAVFGLLLILLLLVASGCSKKNIECETKADCSQGACYTARCIDNKCIKAWDDDCCGNNKCEESESMCSCSADCGRCEAPPGTEFTYLSYQCIDDECLIDTKQSSEKTITETKDFGRFNAIFTLNYREPLNVRTTPITATFELLSVDANVEKPTISKIQIIGTIDRKEIVFAEKDVNRPMWNVGDKVSVDIPITYDFSETPELEIDLAFKVFYEDTFIRDEPLVEQNEYLKKVRSQFILVDPGRDYECEPDQCDDGNPCSTDFCIEGTMICDHTYSNGCCGNYQCETGESKCNCPSDCGTCGAEVTDFLAYGCYKNNCVVMEKEGVVESQTISNTKSFGQFILILKSYIEQPFNINKANFTQQIIMESIEADNLVPPVIITRLSLLSGDKEIGEISPNEPLYFISDTMSVDIPITLSIVTYQEELATTLRVYYQYVLSERTNEKDINGDYIYEDVTYRDFKDVPFKEKVSFIKPVA